MASSYHPVVYDRLLDFLIEKVTPQEILAFSDTDEEQKHADDLIERFGAGKLTREEKMELDQLQEFEKWLNLLKARAFEAEVTRSDFLEESNPAPAPEGISAKKLERDKVDLVYSMFHDLRNPPSIILMGLDLLCSVDTDPESRQEIAKVIRLAANNAMEMVTQVSDVNKMSIGPCDFKWLIDRAVAELRGFAESREISIKTELPTEECRVSGDERQLYGLILNLVTDGIKYTSPGLEVRVSLDVDSNDIKFSVQSPVVKLPNVFTNCFPGGSAKRKPFASLVKFIVDAHGGTIEAETNEEGRIQVTVSFPPSMNILAATDGRTDGETL